MTDSPASSLNGQPSFAQLQRSFLTLRPLLLAQLQANPAARALAPMVYDLLSEVALSPDAVIDLQSIQRVAERHRLQSELSAPLLAPGFAGQERLPNLLETLLNKRPAWIGIFLVEALFAQGLLKRLRSLHEVEREPYLQAAAQAAVQAERLGAYALYRFIDAVCAPRETIAFWKAWRRAMESQPPSNRDQAFCQVLSSHLRELATLLDAKPDEATMGGDPAASEIGASQALQPETSMETGVFRAFCVSPTSDTGSFKSIYEAALAQVDHDGSRSPSASIESSGRRSGTWQSVPSQSREASSEPPHRDSCPPPPPPPPPPAALAAETVPAMRVLSSDDWKKVVDEGVESLSNERSPVPESRAHASSRRKKSAASERKRAEAVEPRTSDVRGLSWLVWAVCAVWAGHGIFKALMGEMDIWTAVGLFAAGGALWALFESAPKKSK